MVQVEFDHMIIYARDQHTNPSAKNCIPVLYYKLESLNTTLITQYFQQ
jgi:hypothetical protein